METLRSGGRHQLEVDRDARIIVMTRDPHPFETLPELVAEAEALKHILEPFSEAGFHLLVDVRQLVVPKSDAYEHKFQAFRSQFEDLFGRIAVVMREPTPSTAPKVTVFGDYDAAWAHLAAD